jgi:hypothetical protein
VRLYRWSETLTEKGGPRSVAAGGNLCDIMRCSRGLRLACRTDKLARKKHAGSKPRIFLPHQINRRLS